ncbi:MAG TPA: DsbA family protein [Nitrospirales bacterium]|nr:DsbA family protein [Nitrospirales bacterium]
MTSSVTLYSDYVGPYCFYAVHLISHVAATEMSTIKWMPLELCPDPQPTLRPDGEYVKMVWWDWVCPMTERLGIPIKLSNIFPQPHTGLAFEGYQYALSQGRRPAYTRRMFTAFFQGERNIGELSVATEQRN